MNAAQRPVPKVRAISCPNCGGSVQLRGMGSSLHAVCINCLGVLDVSKPEVAIVQQFEAKSRRFEPKIPLGSRGKFDGKSYEAIGFQTRALYADGEEYTWDEYVLYNPFQGFRYLTEYAGHWNDIVAMPNIPVAGTMMTYATVSDSGRRYKIFQTAEAKTVFVLGEFPWRVKTGDTVKTDDYIDPPGSLSSESTGQEVTWSKGTYVPGAEIWQAFQLKTTPPAPVGVYSNQPNPYGSTKPLWRMFGLFLLLLFAGLVVAVMVSPNDVAYKANYTFTPGGTEPSFVTPIFELKGGESNVEVEIKTDLENNWAYFGLALINEATGTAYDFGKEVSYYHGSDSDGSWNEGDRKDSVSIGGVPGGKYYLRVEPEMEGSGIRSIIPGQPVNYEITLKRGVAVIWPFFAALPFLLIPPIWGIFRRVGFEKKRWEESDIAGSFASKISGASEDDDD